MIELKQYNQGPLQEYIETLDQESRSILTSELEEIDLNLVTNLYIKRFDHMENTQDKIDPIPGVKLNDVEKDRFNKMGLEAIKNKEVAVVLMAGGQGTRLGHNGPKGTFDIGLPSHKSLFELHCDHLKHLYDLTGTYIHWYIMTSEDNHEDSVSFFESKAYFNYSKDHITFFKQDQLPLLLEDGSLALKNTCHLNLAANGNGGVFTSLKSNSILDKMDQASCQYVFLYGVDNALAKVADPVFIGFMKEKNCDVASKAVDKKDAYEKAGVMCYKNQKPAIVEYTELSEDMRHQEDDQGNLTYRHANILAHLFKLDFLKSCSDFEIPYHVAHKKVDYFDGNQVISPEVPNGFKFELFIFDVFEHANDMAVLSVNREEEFAPVKNKRGEDSPEIAKNLYLNLYSKER